jgi:alkaline phosphatase D
MGHFEFREAPLTDAIAAGIVDADGARLWGRSEVPGPLTIELESDQDQQRRVASLPEGPGEHGDYTFSFRYPDDVPGQTALRPGTRYQCRLLAPGDRLLAQARFETAPASPAEMPEVLSIGALSCHEPFDEHGRVREDARNMLRAVNRAFDEHDVKRVLFMGDQVYADSPKASSLFAPDGLRGAGGVKRLVDCPPEVIRRLYHERYRRFWGVPEFMSLQTRGASTFILDDHEIVDDWGSDPEHASPAWQRVRDGALGAFFDYQGARAHPRGVPRPYGFHHGYLFGDVGVYVTDVRSQRHPGEERNRIFGPRQLDELAAFLGETTNCRVIVLVVSVPLIHLPGSLTEIGQRLLGRGSEFADRWSSPQNQPETARILGLLRRHQQAHPQQRMVLLSGDIHIGCAAMLRPKEGGPPLYELVSSALTNSLQSLSGPLGKLSGKLIGVADEHDFEAELMPGEGANPFTGLNAGILQVVRTGDDVALRWKLISAEKHSATPRVVFDTGLFGGRDVQRG